MAKKSYRIKITSKAYRGIRHSGKTQPKIDAKKLAKALGAKHITDPEEKREFEKKYGLPNLFVNLSKKRQNKKKSRNIFGDAQYKKLKRLCLKSMEDKDKYVPFSVGQYITFIEKVARRYINRCKQAVIELNHGAIHGYDKEVWEKAHPEPYNPQYPEYGRWIHNPPLRFCQYCKFRKFCLTLNLTNFYEPKELLELKQYLHCYVAKKCKITIS